MQAWKMQDHHSGVENARQLIWNADAAKDKAFIAQ